MGNYDYDYTKIKTGDYNYDYTKFGKADYDYDYNNHCNRLQMITIKSNTASLSSKTLFLKFLCTNSLIFNFYTHTAVKYGATTC